MDETPAWGTPSGFEAPVSPTSPRVIGRLRGARERALRSTAKVGTLVGVFVLGTAILASGDGTSAVDALKGSAAAGAGVVVVTFAVFGVVGQQERRRARRRQPRESDVDGHLLPQLSPSVRVAVPGGVSSLALSPDGRLLVTVTDGLWGGTVRAWDLEAGRQLWREHLEDDVRTLAVDGETRLLAFSNGNKVAVWDLLTGSRRGSTSRAIGAVYVLAWVPGGRHRVAGTPKGRVAVIAPPGLTYAWLPDTGAAEIGTIRVSADGCIAAGDRAGGVRVWEASTREKLWEQAATEPVLDLTFGPDGDTLVATSADGSRRAWDVRSGEPRSGLPSVPAARWVVAGPHGDLVAVVDERGELTVRDHVTGRPVADLVEGDHVVAIAAGVSLAAAGRDQVVRLWPWPERHGPGVAHVSAGQQLRVALDGGRHEPFSGPVGRIVRQRRREIIAAAEAHGASRVRVFGSVARGEDRADSDVDLLVDLPPGLGLLGYGRLLDQLEQVLDGLKVDLVPAADLKPEIRARVERDAIPL